MNTKRTYKNRKLYPLIPPRRDKRRHKSEHNVDVYNIKQNAELKLYGKKIKIANDSCTLTHQNQNEAGSLLLSQNNEWFFLGASIRGNAHCAQNLPCQDAHKIALWDNGWGIAVLSDGAGSAAKADMAAKFLTNEAINQAKSQIVSHNWISENYFPDKLEWDKTASCLFENIQNALYQFALKNDTPITDLYATLIMIIFAPQGLLAAHIGDGRAAYQNSKSEWKSLITPFEGEQVGETAFMSMDFKKYPYILETKLVKGRIKAFTLLSDGSEKVCWNTIQLDKITGTLIKPNTPFQPFFENLQTSFYDLRHSLNNDKLLSLYCDYIKDGHSGLKSETDDKTLIMGFNNFNR